MSAAPLVQQRTVSTGGCSPVLLPLQSLLKQWMPLFICCMYVTCRRTAVVVQARRQGGWDSRSRRQGQDDRVFRFKFNQMDVSLAEDQLWRLALPFAALFGLAVFIGECSEDPRARSSTMEHAGADMNESAILALMVSRGKHVANQFSYCKVSATTAGAQHVGRRSNCNSIHWPTATACCS